MATIREWYCEGSCRPVKAGPLFDVLLSVAQEGVDRICPRKHPTPHRLRLGFNFGLNGKDSISTVLGAFIPRNPESWSGRNGTTVRFFPFLVVLRRHGREQAVWLPYWHLVDSMDGRTIKKYGQWAPFMDECHFHELLAQARSKGFFVDGALKTV